jgi:hypothetical protein
VSAPTLVPDRTQAMPDNGIEISVRGQWVRVPALKVRDNTIIVKGGWIKIAHIHDEEWLEAEIGDPEMYVQQLKAQGRRELRADIFTFTQKVPASPPKYQYPMEWSSVAAIRLTSFKEWWESLPQETRKNVRRSQKRGVTSSVKEFGDELIRGISDVNNDSPIRQRVRNAYYGKTLDEVRKDYSAFTDRSDFICAHVGDEMIGFLKLVHRGEVASILNLTTKASHSDKRPANALVARAIELCEAKRVSFVTYGQFNYGNKQDSPLREFKIRNGFGEILKPKFFVPLTAWGTLCMKMKFHRGLLGILPHGMITLGVSVRAKCYNLKQLIKPV